MEGHLGPEVLFHIGGLPISNTVVMTWILMAFLIGVALIVSRKMEMVPKGVQNVMEMIVEFLVNLTSDNIGPNGKKMVPLIATLFIFILGANWMGVIPFLKSPTSDLNTPVALALIVFLTIHVMGVLENGVIGHLKHFLQPSPFMLPLNIVEELSKPLSLSFRLFGNVMGEHVVVAVLAILVPLLLPLPMVMFGMFTGALQAFVFTILSLAYLSNVMGDHH